MSVEHARRVDGVDKVAAAARSPWLRRRVAHPAPRCRLVIFPHAGGTAGPYGTWAAGLHFDGETWVVRYPGREDRLAEPLVDTMDVLVDGIADAILPLATPDLSAAAPLVLFGHSMGASVAYETARRLQARAPGSVARLVVSARTAPTVARPPDRPLVHLLPQAAFIDVLRAHGGTAEEFFEHDELVQLLLPVVRSDYRLIETYLPPPDPTLGVDIVALAATDDPTVAVADVLAWAAVTSAGFTHAVFPGRHFYLQTDPEPVRAELARHLPGGAP